MLTIGGNDARFDNKIQKCVMEGCPFGASMKADIVTAVAETRTVLEQIHALAPKVTISLMGYPWRVAARRRTAVPSAREPCTALPSTASPIRLSPGS